MLIGHSLGGLTVMNLVVHHPNVFNSYVAIDPSMWWDSRKLLNQASETLKQGNFAGKSLFLGIAEYHAGGDGYAAGPDRYFGQHGTYPFDTCVEGCFAA